MASMRSSSTGRQPRAHSSGILSYGSELHEAASISISSVVLPPLYKSKKASLGLRQMKLPGGASDMWTAPEASHKPRPARFREWVKQPGLDIGGDAGAWDRGREMQAPQPKFQSAFRARASSRASSANMRPRSALSNILSTAYLGKGVDADDMASSIAAEMAEAATVASGDENFRLRQELAEIRTGDDAVKFFARHGGNAELKVLYFNRESDEDDKTQSTGHCSLVVVPQHKLKPEHYTISANGVFHVCPGEMSECTPLSEWMHLGMMYSVLKSMPFFKLYAYQKNFQHWRTNARHEAYCRTRQRLSQRSFLAKPMFVGPLAKVHKLVTDVQELPLMFLNQDSQRLRDFRATQHEVLSNANSGARAQLERKQDVLLQVLSALVASVQKAAVEVPAEQEQSRSRGAKAKSMVQEKQEAREQAKRIQMVERDLASLKSFIKLADYMFQGARVASVIDAARAFSKRLDSGQRMFTVEAGFQGDAVVLSPSSDDFSRELTRFWDAALQTVSSLPSLANAQFKQYFSAELKQEQLVEEILSKCGAYQTQVYHIEEVIREQLCVAEAGSNELYARYHHIYEFGEQWDETAFREQAHTFESLASQIKLMSEFKGELAGFRLNRAFGVIHVNGSGLRSTLEPIPEQGLAAVLRQLASLAQETCTTTTQQLSTSIKALDDRPATLQNIESYKGFIEAAESQLETSEEVTQDLEDAWRLLVKQGFRLTLEDQMSVDVLRAKRHDLAEVKLPQARAHLANLGRRASVVVSVTATELEVEEWSLTSPPARSQHSASPEPRSQPELEEEASKSSSFNEVPAEHHLQPPGYPQADSPLPAEASPLEEPPQESIASILRRQATGG